MGFFPFDIAASIAADVWGPFGLPLSTSQPLCQILGRSSQGEAVRFRPPDLEDITRLLVHTKAQAQDKPEEQIEASNTTYASASYSQIYRFHCCFVPWYLILLLVRSWDEMALNSCPTLRRLLADLVSMGFKAPQRIQVAPDCITSHLVSLGIF